MKLRRNGQTAAYCTACGEEIKDVAYIVEARDVTRLLDGASRHDILHYNCIAIAFGMTDANVRYAPCECGAVFRGDPAENWDSPEYIEWYSDHAGCVTHPSGTAASLES